MSLPVSACLRHAAPSVSLAFVSLSALALQGPPFQVPHVLLLTHTAHILQTPTCTQQPPHLWEALPEPQLSSLTVVAQPYVIHRCLFFQVTETSR